ncbi:hypothetical protein DPMN_010525 [Dreissena polymorpha]|uniref:Uncharacterized protein n=1 Tax=Dreissena polymorpha TaxID=45954 RepID=A0A9D4J9U8_DREPO|nr:hypothetical protein DPMN_153920 [Dreissena polymorpha]KAH3886514.1 hypothetical protein DPMN_010525 [Dreissena polymorpha]
MTIETTVLELFIMVETGVVVLGVELEAGVATGVTTTTEETTIISFISGFGM